MTLSAPNTILPQSNADLHPQMPEPPRSALERHHALICALQIITTLREIEAERAEQERRAS